MIHFAHHVPLAPLTTMGVGGPAQQLCDVHNLHELQEVVALAQRQALPLTIVGGGSNIIVADRGLKGLVLRFVGKRLAVRQSEHRVELWVEAGHVFDELIQQAIDHQWAGLTCLSGIPGWCGACPIQNVGAYGREIGQVLLGVAAFDLTTCQITYLSQQQLQLSYRNSRLKRDWRQRYLLMALHLQCLKSHVEEIHYAELQRTLGAQQAPLQTIRQAVLSLRASKGMWMGATTHWRPSCGSFFTNPIVPQHLRQTLQQRHSHTMPFWPVDPQHDKLSAAWLLEQSGFTKGWQARRVPVGLSPYHALCLINLGQATSQAIVETAEAMRQQVWQTFQVELTPEPEHLGFANSPYRPLALSTSPAPTG